MPILHVEKLEVWRPEVTGPKVEWVLSKLAFNLVEGHMKETTLEAGT